jgi:hypothetical protein
MIFDADTQKELIELFRLGRKFKWAMGEERQFLEANGVNLARSDFYSEVPTLSEIESSFEYLGSTSVKDTQAIFDHPDIFPEKILRKYAIDLVEYAADFDVGDFEPSGAFSWQKGQLIGNDAMALFAIVRKFKPRKVVEIGSGQSTFVSISAIRANASGSLYCIDPEPRKDITEISEVKFARERIQDINPNEIIEILEPGDVIFYDGEHSLKSGNSAVYFYHFILPYLKPGVIVHVHDVRLPYPRNIDALIKARLYWTEPYIVMAYLRDLSRYRVLFGSEYALRRFPDIAGAMMHGLSNPGGVSLWFEVLNDGRKVRKSPLKKDFPFSFKRFAQVRGKR